MSLSFPLPGRFRRLSWTLATLPATALADIGLYFQANLGLESAYVDGGPSITRVSDYSSRIGLRGKEVLTDGWRMVWQYETGVRLDDGSSSGFASRDSYVGVAGPLGEVRLGKHDSPYKLISGALDLFGSRTSSYSTLFHNQGAGWNNGIPKFDSRLNNAVAYWTPANRPWQLNLMYAADETATPGQRSPIWSGSARYTRAGLQLAAGSEIRLGQNPAGNRAVGNQLLASYEYAERALLGVGLEQLRLAAEHRSGWVAAWQHPVGAFRLKMVLAGAQATGARDTSGRKLDNGALHWSAGFDYGLSRHFNLIAFFSRLDNLAAGSYEFTAYPLAANPPGSAGHDSNVLALGFMYKL